MKSETSADMLKLIAKTPQGKFQYLTPDERVALALSRYESRPILANTPFGMSEIQESLKAMGHNVKPVFVIEKPETLKQRYQSCEGKDIPKGHLTRQETYIQRAQEQGAFSGTSSDVLNHLKESKE